MKLNDEKKKIVVEKLSGFLANPCNVCHSREWVMNDNIFEIREFHGGDLVLGSPTSILPVMSVACTTCGNTLFFNAIQLGLVEKNDPLKLAGN